jgi:glycosyltransferase involved in cell wall biosynthesis
MKRLLLINVTANSGSTGRIAENIGKAAIARGYDSYFAYGRKATNSNSHLIHIGNEFDVKLHAVQSMLFDNHGFCSKTVTRAFIREIERIKPDIINIHNIHGYYINVEILFEYLKMKGIPVVWTLHDCWPVTGHCSYFDRYNCSKWKTGCYNCPNIHGYPKSILLDNSKRNYWRKKACFCGHNNLTLVTPCNWMKDIASKSFLQEYSTCTIYNGVDIEVFAPGGDVTNVKSRLGIDSSNKVVLGVANTWDRRKGFDDFMKLRSILQDDFTIVLVGLSEQQIKQLPEGVIGISKTENINDLADLYSMSDVFVNPTYVDNFPTTNIEALACGTPVVTYRTGGCPEAIDAHTGMVVDRGNLSELVNAIKSVASHESVFENACRQRAVLSFNKDDRFKDYVALFDSIICK